MKLVECVPNFSVGNDSQIIDKIASSIQSINGFTLFDIPIVHMCFYYTFYASPSSSLPK